MSFSEWKKIKLEDAVKIVDSLHVTPKYAELGYPIIRVQDINEGLFDIQSPLYVSKEVYEKYTKNHRPQIGDILFTRVGANNGISSYVNTNVDFCIGQNTCILTEYKKGVYSKYIYYIMVSNIIKNQIQNMNTGSTHKTISLGSIKNFEIYIPPYNEQKVIADILYSIDEKIELNKRINKNLEKISQTIFKSWFVDFQPFQEGEFEESEMGRIPKGWKISELSSVVVVNKRGFSPKYNRNNEGVPVINQRCIRNHTIIEEAVQYHDNDVKTAPEDSYIKPFDILINSMGVGTLGRVAQIAIINDAKIVHSCVTILRANESLIVPTILGYFIKSVESIIECMGTGSTGQTSLSNKVLGALKFVLPPLSIQLEIGDALTNILVYIDQNNLESKQLQQIRDTLLPKLMSGEIRVPIKEVK
ncbi:restriction endonuclease subunit S [Clostridium sp.]|uniref:restriction endonuclease subunit S n=1 Tax=Clostridium sp. TaxID=1506 RepID=UPI003D6CDB4E